MSGISTRFGWLLGVVMSIWSASCALAQQITPDGTLPNNSIVTQQGKISIITGGTKAGSNLFHSFREFSVPTNGTAYFNNALDIQNIISRVTGKSISNIDGLIKANGAANLFLINPNGIIFGPNARLDIGGSFVATTANALAFGNQGFFSATNPNTSELLTVNPSAFFFNQIAAPIQNNSIADSGLNPSSAFIARGLRVPDGKSLLLVGGDINMNGGGLFAFGGRVELGGLRSAGTVGLNGDGNNLSLSFPDSVERSDVFLSNGAGVNVTAGDGGSIAVNARNLEMTGESFLRAGIESGLGSNNSKAGNISVNATGAINLNNGSRIANEVLPEASGQGGDVNISANTLQVLGGAQVSTSTSGAGKGGSLRVDAQDVQLIGTGADSQFPSGLFTGAGNAGASGDITIATRKLLVRDGAQISSNTFFNPKDGAQISSNTFFNPKDRVQVIGLSQGGDLIVTAKESVELSGTSANGRLSSGLFTNTRGIGDAGSLTIETPVLLVRNGAQVDASTNGSGKGGQLTVNALKSVELIGTSNNGQTRTRSGLSAASTGTGNAGDLIIRTNTLLLQDGAEANVSSRGTGNAGDLDIFARSIKLDNQARLTAETISGKDGNIKLQVPGLLLLRRGSSISNTAGTTQAGGSQGNFTANIGFLVAVPNENSDITANAYTGTGGNIQITAQGIFGTQFQKYPTPESDITATGIVTLKIPDIDPSKGLVQLPTKFVDVSQQIDTRCNPGSKYRDSSFIITGRGGLPPNPKDILTPDAIEVGWVTLNPEIKKNSRTKISTNPTVTTPEPIVEATGWVINEKGQVVFTADATPHSSWQNPVSCHAS
ncbi:MAG: filamentous hemagglutinin N-terminal domain-containing protein [Iphinoe sp. HA4291-MV1]|jgi:filamentous hemagglutinin family protein|nr:filamentous hemagglutinin N-terminal domain-containing protein [Iphinoe sp. HA4291-MV1]